MYEYYVIIIKNFKFFYFYLLNNNFTIFNDIKNNSLIINFNTDEFLIVDLNNNSFLIKLFNYSFYFFDKNFNLIFYFLIIYLIIDLNIFNFFKKKLILQKINNFFNTYLFYFFEKSESSNEGIILLKIFIFFIFILISNFFFFDYYTNFIMFLDWYLPIIFGIFIIIENIIIITIYIYIYLTGSKQRKFFIGLICEDLINFIILNSRIFLQLIRGIICCAYHDFLRNNLFNFFNNFYLELFFDETTPFYHTLNLLFFFIISIFLNTFAIILMFLQILFLFLAIWLFTKCWFISYKNGFIFNYLIKNKFNE